MCLTLKIKGKSIPAFIIITQKKASVYEIRLQFSHANCVKCVSKNTSAVRALR